MGTEPTRLQERLEEALGPACTIERELGGGGMSRVFLVNDARRGRRIVVTALHPDLAADVSAVRFEPEVRLVANADRYALGVMCELLVDSHPFAGRTPRALVVAHRTEAPTCPRRTQGARSRHAIQEVVLTRSSFPPPTGGRFK